MKRGRPIALASLHLLFGVMLIVGPLGEIAVALVPSLLGAAQADPIMRAHQTEPILKAWVLGSNFVNLACGVEFLWAGAGWLRGRAGALRLGGMCALIEIAIVLCGGAICAVYLYPLVAPDLASADSSRRTDALVLLFVIFSPVAILPGWMVVLLLWGRSAAARLRAP